MSSVESYFKRTADELGVAQAPTTVSGMLKLTQSIRELPVRDAAVSPTVVSQPITYLGKLLRRLVKTNAQFEDVAAGAFLCGTAEWNFFEALRNPNRSDGRKGDYSQTTIYVNSGKPILVTKGDPHGKLATIVCDEVPGDDRFVAGVMGILHNAYGFTPDFKKPTPGILVRELNDGLTLNVVRPSTFVAFPLEARLGLLYDSDKMRDVHAEVHQTNTIEDLAKLASRFVKKPRSPNLKPN